MVVVVVGPTSLSGLELPVFPSTLSAASWFTRAIHDHDYEDDHDHDHDHDHDRDDGSLDGN